MNIRHFAPLLASGALLIATSLPAHAGTAEFQLEDGSFCWSTNTTITKQYDDFAPEITYDHLCGNLLFTTSPTVCDPNTIEGQPGMRRTVNTYNVLWHEPNTGSPFGVMFLSGLGANC